MPPPDRQQAKHLTCFVQTSPASCPQDDLAQWLAHCVKEITAETATVWSCPVLTHGVSKVLYLDQARNRKLFMSGSIIATIALVALLVPGINAVGVIMAAAILNIFVYYAMPDSYSPAYMEKRMLRHEGPTMRRNNIRQTR